MMGIPGIFVKGMVIGLMIAAPVGPIGVLCIQRTISYGRWFGLISGIRAATADMCYGCLAALGVTGLVNVLTGHEIWFRVVGGIVFCALGIQAWRTRPAEHSIQDAKRGYIGADGSTFVLTLLNPMTILSFAAIITSVGLIGKESHAPGLIALIIGVFLGSSLSLFW